MDSGILAESLEVALKARRIDVAASPYAADRYLDGLCIKIETEEGRREYKSRQMELMKESVALRERVISAYEHVLDPKI